MMFKSQQSPRSQRPTLASPSTTARGQKRIKSDSGFLLGNSNLPKIALSGLLCFFLGMLVSFHTLVSNPDCLGESGLLGFGGGNNFKGSVQGVHIDSIVQQRVAVAEKNWKEVHEAKLHERMRTLRLEVRDEEATKHEQQCERELEKQKITITHDMREEHKKDLADRLAVQVRKDHREIQALVDKKVAQQCGGGDITAVKGPHKLDTSEVRDDVERELESACQTQLAICQQANNMTEPLANGAGGSSSISDEDRENLEKTIRSEISAEYAEKLSSCRSHTQEVEEDGDTSSKSFGKPDSILPPHATGKFVIGMARTEKVSFAEELNLGVPLDLPQYGMSDVLLLYNRDGALPSHYEAEKEHSGPIPHIQSASQALENCDYLNVILTNKDGKRKQCVALVPQYESYHVLKYMRVDPFSGRLNGTKRPDGGQAPLSLVSRGQSPKGHSDFVPPRKMATKRNWDILQTYWRNLPHVTKELGIVLENVTAGKDDKTVIVMVCNFGQSELLMNFVCAAKSRSLDETLSRIVVFSTDPETTELAKSLGLAAFYDEKNFESIPSEAAGQYGDRKFTAMMMAKVMSVQLVSALGYDFLFQDVDIVWFKDPLEYFKLPAVKDFDAVFQDDGGHSVRYAPYSANSGFYFIRNNRRTEHLLTALLMNGDMVLMSDSHQQALIAIMSEHVSLYGLKVKVVSRDTDDLPGGYHFHQKTGKYMRKFFKGEVEPYIFHMSWTKNKDNKQLFLKQMAEWYVKQKCIGKKTTEIGNADVKGACCSPHAIVSCHYRDKPSKEKCPDSPTLDKGAKSFW